MAARAQPADRSRKYVTPDEASRMIEAAGESSKERDRDRALISLMYHHGLRVIEATALQWHAVDWEAATLFVARAKSGIDGTHPLRGADLKLLRNLHRDRGKPLSGFLFMSNRGSPMSPDTVARIVARAGVVAGVGMPVHPHMLRHGCGYALANRHIDTRTIQEFLGHADIRNTVIYTALAPTKYQRLWRD